MDYYTTNGAGVFIKNPWSSTQDGATLFKEVYRIPGIDLDCENVPGAIHVKNISDLTGLEARRRIYSEIIGYKVKASFAKVIADLGVAPRWPLAECVVDSKSDEWEYTDSFKDYAAMFEVEKSEQRDEWDPSTEHRMIAQFDITDYGNPRTMQVKVHVDEQWLSSERPKVEKLNLGNVASMNEIERMLTPEFMHHERPCWMDSKSMYQVIRAYVKEHIDHDKAVVTSDYDFCFTVKRKRRYAKAKVTRTEIKTAAGRSYKVPRYRTKTEDFELVELFEMTHNRAEHGRGYGKYTVMEAMHAENLADLYDRLTVYLQDLMAHINADYRCCPYCEGQGMVEKTAKFTKKLA